MVRYTRGRKLDALGDSKQQNPARISGNNNMKKITNSSVKASELKQLQDILNIKTEQQQSRKVGFAQQNIQFARENTSLKTKITELELKLNDLLKENLQLRQNNVSNKIQYESHLNEQICLLENGVFQRFDEIILMFDNVRKRENLPANKSSQWMKYHQQSEVSNSLKNNTITPSKKRNRRKSMFIQSDDLPMLDKLHNDQLSNDKLHNDKENFNLNSSVSETIIHESSIPILEHPDNVSKEDTDMEPNNDIDTSNMHNENTGTSSVLDCPIPEEKEEEAAEEEEEEEEENSDVNLIIYPSNESYENSKNASTPPIEQSQENISSTPITKKTQRKRTTKIPPPIIKKNQRKSVSKDDKMPQTNIDVNKIEPTHMNTTLEENASGIRPTRRSTRGKVVNYKLPSLRAKMRRPKEQLVDATTVNNIHEYEVNVKIEQHEDSIPPKMTPTKIENINTKDDIITNSKKKLPKKKTIVTKKTTDIPQENKPKKNTTDTTKENKSNKNTIPNDSIPNDSIIHSEDNTSNDIITIPISQRKTSVYNDPEVDSNDFFVDNNTEPFSTPTNTTKPTQKNNKKRSRNSLLDDEDEEKENDSTSRTNIPPQKKNSAHRYAFDLKVNKNIMSSSPLMSSKISSSNNNNNNSSSQILSDITNTTKPNRDVNQKRKKKLLKRPIINDLYNDAEDLDIYDSLSKKSPSPSLSSSSTASFRSLSSSFHHQGSSSNKSLKEGKTVSFRFSDDDLSVFDLVDQHRNNKKSKPRAVGK